MSIALIQVYLFSMLSRMNYRRLDAEQIIRTAERLEQRIAERFPEAGLRGVARELVALAGDTRRDAARLAGPIVWLRLLIVLTVVLGGGVFLFVGTFLSFDRAPEEGLDLVQGIEAGINTLVLAGIGLIALMRTEARIKERAVLKGLHALRTLVHVIDMHQLTKDPVVFTADFRPTPSSPKRGMSRSDLKRYLDYCSELLSITGKLAALYAQAVYESAVVEAVNDIETLGSDLSRKVWQKITLLQEGVSPSAQPDGGTGLLPQAQPLA